ncbi:MAG: hypothetical protein KKF46_02590 [Nanoarchaeota archaeon]|nr:hypothetical protein [Nanoarchaeota archaeon]MBU1321219.1 hypothetical protein [Nanoarchaeota archaeon]MBU1597024.1 hypothetical protein [Nanoarchaeota archaeon]MBU2441830.1 hypothetical protein [Nanoarchaeota archaeon]
MRITKHDKFLLFEQELVALIFIIILGFVFYWFKFHIFFYLVTLLIGFILFFWMIFEEKIHKTGKKHSYFEHTSSYIMVAQTVLVLGLLFLYLDVKYLIIIFLVISVIMYSIGLSRIILFKTVFKK